MEKGRKKSRIIKFVILCCMAFLCLFSFTFSFGGSIAYAENVVYSNVMEDLQKDENFDINDYPVVEDDYSLKVIQIAESSANELFVYVYQPCSPNADLVATSISLSISIGDDYSPVLYSLQLLSSYQTLHKYKLKSFSLPKSDVRSYEIVSICRKWNEKYDEQPDGGNTVDEVAYEVGEIWTCVGSGSDVSYSCSFVETVTVTDKYVGFVRYEDGLWGIPGYTDSHYVAFSTDHKIDDLIEADVFFVEVPICAYYNLTGWHYLDTSSYGNKAAKERYVYITENDVATNSPSWLFGEKYVRDRIQSVDDFLLQENVSQGDLKDNLQGKTWVLRFFESKYRCDSSYYYWTNVREVSILRLKFETHGICYNLGVVDNKQSGSGIPDLVKKSSNSWWKIVLLVLGIIILIVALPVILPVLFFVIKYLFIGLWYVLKGVWWVITLPFKLFKKSS